MSGKVDELVAAVFNLLGLALMNPVAAIVCYFIDTISLFLCPRRVFRCLQNKREPTSYELTHEQKYEFDLQVYIVLNSHYEEQAVAEIHVGIDELQATLIDYETYSKLEIANYYPVATKDL